MGPPDIKKMISIKIKPRKDPYSDQFSRIVMLKMMMLTAAVTGISWAKDKVRQGFCQIREIRKMSGKQG